MLVLCSVDHSVLPFNAENYPTGEFSKQGYTVQESRLCGSK